jgi:hypothetical protein
MHGCRYASGARYEGKWKGNLKHGNGVYHYSGGGSFEGEFVQGKRSGVGVRLWPHGAAKVNFHVYLSTTLAESASKSLRTLVLTGNGLNSSDNTVGCSTVDCFPASSRCVQTGDVL